jgi:hypothetical protein
MCKEFSSRNVLQHDNWHTKNNINMDFRGKGSENWEVNVGVPGTSCMVLTINTFSFCYRAVSLLVTTDRILGKLVK